jgi:DNA-directed RNA polymerase specialized sigma24 family protein
MGSNDFQEKVEATEQEHRLYEAINQLPAQCRKVFIMSRLEEKKIGFSLQYR